MRTAIFLLAALVVTACGSDPTAPRNDGGNPAGGQTGGDAETLTDAAVFALAAADSAWVWYKRSADTLSPAGDSPHALRLRTRYNAVAATHLDTSGKVSEVTLFSNGSVIVKEVYDGSGALALLAVIIKATGDPNAGHGDWLWAEYTPDGGVVHSITAPEGSCHDCHFSGIDHTRMNDAHP